MLFVGLFLYIFPCFSQNIPLPDSLKNLSNSQILTKINTFLTNKPELHYPEDKAFTYHALFLAKKLENNIETVTALENIGIMYLQNSLSDSALLYFRQGLQLAKISKNKKGQLLCNYYLAQVFNTINQLDTALNYGTAALYGSIEMKDSARLASVYNLLGITYDKMNYFDLAIDQFQKSLKIKEKFGNLQAIATTSYNIATLYAKVPKFDKAITYYSVALHLKTQIHDEPGKMKTLQGFGNVYENMQQYDLAKKYYQQALILADSLKDYFNSSNLYNSLGNIYFSFNEFGNANEMYNKALNIKLKIIDVSGIVNSYKGIARICLKQNNLKAASENIINAEKFIARVYDKKQKLAIFEIQKDIQFALGNYKAAFEYQSKYIALRDSLTQLENRTRFDELQVKYDSDKKDNEMILSKKEFNYKVEKEQNIRNFILLIAFFIIASTALLYSRYRTKVKANKLLEEKNTLLAEQKKHIEEQHTIIEIKNQNITDSIRYAGRIQHAMLPSFEILEKSALSYFMLYKPCHIVSGDFYWFRKIDNFIFIAAADCTGHGVPGAFMSMLGISHLNEILNKHKAIPPNQILNELRQKVKESLHQTGEIGEQQDGMDIALCRIDLETKSMLFSGAYNPLYIIRENKIIEYKADKMPIGVHPKDKNEFTNKVIQLQKNDYLYMFSDGYTSQFGGENDELFKSKRFQQLLLSIYQLPPEQQKQQLQATIESWAGNHAQTDDILVIGISMVTFLNS